MFILGLTGTMGSGKSTVSRIIKNNFGAFVIDADKIAKDVLSKDTDCYYEVVSAFTDDKILAVGGAIDRKKLAKIVFSDKKKLDTLNKITHKYIIREIKNQIDTAKQNGVSFVLLDVPLLFSPDFPAEICDKTLSVVCKDEKKIERVKKRDGISRQDIINRLKNQLSDKEMIEKADFYIVNDFDTEDELSKQVNDFMRQLDI